MPRRFAPRNDSPDPLSFREGPTGRRGNPSFLRWPWVRAVVPRAWPPPTKFRPEIWGVGQVVGPYGKPNLNHSGQPARSEASAPADARDGRKSPQRPSQQGDRPRDCRGSALSAERVAGQIQSLPNDLRVQHGVQRLEVSAKPRPCSRRGCVN